MQTMQCEKGNAVNYLMAFHNMGYQEACHLLGVQPTIAKGFDRQYFINNPLKYKPGAIQMPSDEWPVAAMNLVKWAHAELFKTSNKSILDKLNTERGLRIETIKKYKLGWIYKNLELDIRDWGLPIVLDYTGYTRSLSIPAGLLIPGYVNGNVCRIRIRKSNRDDGSKYYMVPGCPITH